MIKFIKSNRKVKRDHKDIEPQEVFLDKLASKKEEEISEKRFEVPVERKQLLSLFFLFFLLILLLFGRTFYFQVVKGKEFSLLAQQNKERKYLIRSVRGVIYDKDMKQLVFNKASFDLIYDKRDLPHQEEEKKEVVKKVASILGEDFSSLREKIESSDLPQVLIKENLEHDLLISLETRIKELDGFKILDNKVREYKEGETFAHLIGYTGKISKEELKEGYSIADYIGKAGLEKYYEEILRGKPGYLRVEKDASNKVLSEEVVSSPEPGYSLVLHLDSSLQRKIEKELKKALNRVGAEKGVAIALNPRNGGLLSLVSIPSYNPNFFSQGSSRAKAILKDPQQPLFNRALSGVGYPTGSTIKPLIAAAALEEGIINPNRSINDKGKIVVKNPYFDPENPESGPKEWVYHDWKIHGVTDLRKAIAVSCNVYFYTIGGGYGDIEGLGAKRIKQWIKKFGWGKKTGIDLPNEGAGALPKIDKDWSLGKTYHFSIGQGPFAVTPLQVANAFVAIANNGKLLKPQVVDKIIDSDKKVVKDLEKKVVRKDFLSPNTLKAVREGMRDTVRYGSASNLLSSLPVKAAAKTGTAQTGKENHYHHWVVVFAPFENPEIVLVVMIENVKGLQSATLPVAKSVLEWYFSR